MRVSAIKNRMKIVVIGSGFGGLAAAIRLQANGHRVTIVEKRDKAGGRAYVYEQDGFKFDMGPSWYWMPDVFENFFAIFGKKPSDFYDLKRLDPGYRVYYAHSGSQVVLLLAGGDKRTQDADIERAVSYWQDWQER